ncbi:MAG: tetratricopeptide repeat protein [Clostridia bacterium]|nr:hypothetical protein [Clostridia bacterium]
MEMEEIAAQINRANAYVKKGKFLEAERIVDKLAKNIEPVEINKYGRVFDFSNKLEFFLYCHINGKTNISWSRNFLSDIYLIKGIVFYEGRNFKNAIAWFEKALKWNPVSMHIYNELLESCINLRDYNRFDMYFQRAIKLAMRPIDIATLYKKLGYVWIEKGQEEIAYNLMLYSKLFFPRQAADLEIDYLEKRIGTKLKRYPDLGTIEYLKEKGLLYKRPNYIVPTYFSVIKAMEDIMKKDEYKTRANYLTLMDYYNGLYFHRPGGQIHSALLALQREYEINFPIQKGGEE